MELNRLFEMHACSVYKLTLIGRHFSLYNIDLFHSDNVCNLYYERTMFWYQLAYLV